jgi:hypothetical protein
LLKGEIAIGSDEGVELLLPPTLADRRFWQTPNLRLEQL